MESQQNISPNKIVPTNIITGFLGVGKTTAILHLLKSKPSKEKWAVLVNEFGEVGVDGSLLAGQHQEQHGVFVREVPGGCMCCAAGLPMQIALNQLLTRAKPDRLLIEPTGLGHPKEVLEVLRSEYYTDILHIQKNITLVDARKLRDNRYTKHDTFNQQIDVADVVIGNKQDLYESGDQELLEAYVEQRLKAAQRRSDIFITFSQHGKIDPTLLKGTTQATTEYSHHHHHHEESVVIDTPDIPSSGYIKVENQGEGYKSIGWRFSPNKVFHRELLYSWLSGLQVERLKAVFITHDGIFGYNKTPDALIETELDDSSESRIEIIAREIESGLGENILTLAS